MTPHPLATKAAEAIDANHVVVSRNDGSALPRHSVAAIIHRIAVAPLADALAKGADALERSYDAQDWPANGESLQEVTAKEIRALISGHAPSDPLAPVREALTQGLEALKRALPMAETYLDFVRDGWIVGEEPTIAADAEAIRFAADALETALGMARKEGE